MASELTFIDELPGTETIEPPTEKPKRASRSKQPPAPTPISKDRLAELDRNMSSAIQTISYLAKHPEILISLDTETTGFKIKDNRDYAIGISLAFHANEKWYSYYYPIAHTTGWNLPDEHIDALSDLIESRDEIVFQNAKFDLVSLKTLGIDYTGIFYDTLTWAQLLDENQPLSKDLNSLSLYYLNEPGKIDDPFVDYEKKHGNQRIDWQHEWEYACKDAETTLKLYYRLEPLVEAEGLWGIWDHKQELIRVLNTMERRGVRIDTELSSKVAAEGRKRMAEITDELGLNPGSPKQLKELLIDRLGLPILKKSEKTGAPSFDKSVMPTYERMLERDDDPTAKLVMEYRGWQKAVTASYEPYVELVSPDGRLRCNYRLDTARTGRFSCESPNLQQIPKDGDKPWNKHTKACFIPEDGYVIVNADYSQLELRLGTLYAQEQKLKTVFAEGRDIFTEMAAQLGMTRQDTKTLTYSMQYGAGEKRIMDAFGVDRERARQMRQNYFNTYPRFKLFSDMCTARAEDVGKVKIWSGRYRHFMFKSDSYKAMNSVIQGGAADIVERVMVKVFDTLDDEDECRMLLQVHDALVFEIREGLVDEYLPLIREVMGNVAEACGLEDFNDVVFAVDAGPDYGSKHWSKAA